MLRRSVAHLSRYVINVADPQFGTNPPDGTADNTAQILAAITAACGGDPVGAQEGRFGVATLLFPRGTWRFTQRLRFISMLNMEILGDSAGGTFLMPMGTWADESAAVELNGLYHCVMKDITFLQGSGTSPTFDDVVTMDWTPAIASRSSTGNSFNRVSFRNIKWRNSALAIGRFSSNLQVDNGSYYDLDIGGGWDGSSTTMYQAGVHVGSGTHGNILNHHFYNLTSSVCRYNLVVQSVSVVDVWGGSFGNAEADVRQSGAITMCLSGIRSEASGRFFIQDGGASYGSQIAIRDVIFNASNINADGRFIRMGYGGGLHLDNVTVSANAAVVPRLYVDVPSSRLAIATTGCSFQVAASGLAEITAGSAGRVVQSHRAYCQLAANVPSAVTASLDI